MKRFMFLFGFFISAWMLSFLIFVHVDSIELWSPILAIGLTLLMAGFPTRQEKY